VCKRAFGPRMRSCVRGCCLRHGTGAGRAEGGQGKVWCGAVRLGRRDFATCCGLPVCSRRSCNRRARIHTHTRKRVRRMALPIRRHGGRCLACGVWWPRRHTSLKSTSQRRSASLASSARRRARWAQHAPPRPSLLHSSSVPHPPRQAPDWQRLGAFYRRWVRQLTNPAAVHGGRRLLAAVGRLLLVAQFHMNHALLHLRTGRVAYRRVD
jgi:hypothetical protein